MDALADLIGESPRIVALREKIARLLQRQSEARRFPPVLIQGETGTGKGLVAQILHRAGRRASGPFIDVNCAAIPETLLESELFGFERGAFTDARQAKPGLLQAAHRGIVFLDEVGLLPLALQAKLLKVIEEQAVRRLGSTRSEPVDIWIVTASNVDLAAAVAQNKFREDLYHRLAVVPLPLPPLRDRGEDVLRLAERFLARSCADYEVPAKTLAPDARAALLAHQWDGNVRELANVMERVALLSEVSVATADVLGLAAAPPPTEPTTPRQRDLSMSLSDAVGSVERAHLLEALQETRWNVTRAAARLGVSRDKVRYGIVKHGLRSDASPARRRPQRARPAAPPAPAAAPAAVPSTGGPVRWERRRLAVLRVALVVPPETDARLYPGRALEVLVDKVQSFGGRVEELSPMGLVAAFGVQAVEDAPRRAAHAAMAIRTAAERDWHGAPDPPAVKLGIHVGHFLIGEGIGPAQLDLDSKRQAWTVLEGLVGPAGPGAILVSNVAAPLLQRHFDLAPAGVAEGPTGQVYRLARGERTGLRSRGRMARFAGRQQELEFLRSRLVSAARGQGHVVGILGEAGIGKSRLLFEFRRTLATDQVLYLAVRCYSHTSAIPYVPAMSVLRKLCGITETDDPRAITEKLGHTLRAMGIDAEAPLPYLLQFLGVKPAGEDALAVVSPEAIRSRTLAALVQIALQGSRRRPTLLVVEDLQWIDRSTEECLSLLVERLAGASLLVICTYRPGHRPLWIDKSHATQIALQPLSPQESLGVLHSVLRESRPPDPLVQLILDKAEGNPFFLEELSRGVDEQGTLGETGSVPDTVEEVLLTRIHRLADEPKRLLQAASVLGREVPLGLLAAIWDGPGSLDPHLQELTRQEFLIEETGLAEPAHLFRHALTQEVAYGSLPLPRRQALHAAAGQAVETLHGDRLEDTYNRLAYHYSRSDQPVKAVEYLTRLADKAARGYALNEAIRALEEALGHVERLPPSERDGRRLDLILREASCLIYLGRFQEALGILLRSEAGVERLGNPALAGLYHLLLARVYFFLGDEERVVQCAHRSIAEAQRAGDRATMGMAHYVLAQLATLSGRAPEGIGHARQALALLGPTGEQWWIGQAHWALGLNQALTGEFGAALEAQARAHAIGEAIASRQVQACAAWGTGIVHTVMGDWEAGVEACQRALALAPDPLNWAITAGWTGYAYLEKGDGASAVPLLEKSTRQLGQFQYPHIRGVFTAFLAEAVQLGGETEKAFDLAMQALDATSGAKSPYGVAVARRALGRIAAARGNWAEAANQLDQGLRAFASIEARYDLARTHLDLGVVGDAQGDREASLAHLREACDLFRAMGVSRYLERAQALIDAHGRTSVTPTLAD